MIHEDVKTADKKYQNTAEYIYKYYVDADGVTRKRKVRPHQLTFKNAVDKINFQASGPNSEPATKQTLLEPGTRGLSTMRQESIQKYAINSIVEQILLKKRMIVPDKKNNESDIEADEKLKATPSSEVGSSHIKRDSESPFVRKAKINYVGEEVSGEDSEESPELDRLSDRDLEKIASTVRDEHDIMDVYSDDELHLVDSDTGEPVSESLDHDSNRGAIILDEVLSRIERIRVRARFARSEAKRERKIQIALKTRSSGAVLNRRARELAINLLKQKLAKRPVNQLSVGEKERIERILEKKKKVVNRLALKLIPRIRIIENERMTHRNFTKNGEK